MTFPNGEPQRRSEHRKRVSMSGMARALGWVTVGAAVLSVVGQRVWPLELLVHFWPQIAVLLLATGLHSIFSGSRLGGAGQILMAVSLSVTVAWNVVTASAERPGGRSPVGTGALQPELRAMFANPASWNLDHDPLLATIRRVRPDVVGLVEMNRAWLKALESLADEYPHTVIAPSPNDYGVALLSRLPLSSTSTEAIGPLAELPSIVATVETPGGPWRVIVMHAVPPFHTSAFASRNHQIGAIGERLGPRGTPTVVLADLNATPWSPYVRDLRRETGLRSAARGLRARYTWPAGIAPLALELDHCLFSEPGIAVGYRVLNNIRSDHYPFLCELSRRP